MFCCLIYSYYEVVFVFWSLLIYLFRPKRGNLVWLMMRIPRQKKRPERSSLKSSMFEVSPYEHLLHTFMWFLSDFTCTNVFNFTDNSERAFYKELVKVIELSDVILEVLDARDPLGTRCTDMERMVMQAGPNKHLVLLLNKIGKFLYKSLLVDIKCCLFPLGGVITFCNRFTLSRSCSPRGCWEMA